MPEIERRYFEQFGKPMPVELIRDYIFSGECFYDEAGNRIAPERVQVPPPREEAQCPK